MIYLILISSEVYRTQMRSGRKKSLEAFHGICFAGQVRYLNMYIEYPQLAKCNHWTAVRNLCR